MDFQKSISDMITNLTQNVDISLVSDSIIPKLIDNINQSSTVKQEAKNKLNAKFNNTGFQLKQIRLSSLRGGGEEVTKEALEVIIAHFLSDINKYDAKLINLLSDANVDEKVIVTFLIVNNLDDINAVIRDNNISSNLAQNIITLKKLSALYRIERNF